MNREVNLTKRVLTAKGPRYCPVAFSANGRVKPDVVIIDGKPEHHPEGSYYLEWREGSKRVRLSVGKMVTCDTPRMLASWFAVRA
jgi:integrase/recombinase XerD